MTKLFAVGGVGAAAFAAFAAARRRREVLQQRELDEIDYELDAYDQYEQPIVVTDEIIIVSEPEDMIEEAATATEDQTEQQQTSPASSVTGEQPQQSAEPSLADFHTPGRDAPPR